MTAIAETALVGWREKVADQVSEPIADHTPLQTTQVRSIVAAVLFGLSAYYVLGTVRRALAQAQS